MPSLLSIIEKQSRHGSGAYLWLLEIELPYGETLRVVRNTENIEWPTGSGTIWNHIWFDFDDIQEGGGEAQELTMRVSNVSGAMLRHVEQLEDYRKVHGREPIPMRLINVNSNLLAQAEPEAEYWFEEHGIDVPEPMRWVLVTVGADRLFGKVFPARSVLTGYCPWTQVEECPHVATCDRNLATCRGTYINSVIFGGFPVTSIEGAHV